MSKIPIIPKMAYAPLYSPKKLLRLRRNGQSALKQLQRFSQACLLPCSRHPHTHIYVRRWHCIHTQAIKNLDRIH